MTIWTQGGETRPLGRRIALWALWGALPFITVAYQVAAKETAGLMSEIPFGLQWLGTLLRTPWAQVLMALEIAGFMAWMAILAEMKLSAAFPMSAVSYVLVVATGWLWFHEPVTLLQVLGGAAILAGVRMIGQADDPPADGAV